MKIFFSLFLVIAFSLKSSANTITDTIPAKYPGGDVRFALYIVSNLDEDKLKKGGIKKGNYPFSLSFITDELGNVSQVEFDSVTEKSALLLQVEQIAKKSKWTPAQADGKKVSYLNHKKITLRLDF